MWYGRDALGPRVVSRQGAVLQRDGWDSQAVRLTLLEAFGQDLGQLGPDGRLGPDQPLKVLAAQPEELARCGAPHGGQTRVAVAASPVAGGELAEMLTGAEGTDQPFIDENLVKASQRDVEEPVCIPLPDDLLTGSHVDAGAAVADSLNDRIGHIGQQGHGRQHVCALTPAVVRDDASPG